MALDLNDKTANGNTLTNNGGVTEVTANLPFAQSTSAADLEASSSQSFSAADSASLSITGDLTFEIWANPESLPGAGTFFTLIGKYTVTGNKRSYLFYLNNTGGVYTLKLNYSSDGTTA